MKILPGATLGILGGGQLGRLFILAAHDLGYRIIVLDPDPDSPAGRVADEHLHAAYDDPWALKHLATNCAAITTEFENIPVEALEYLAHSLPVYPQPQVVRITQNRITEKCFLRERNLPTVTFVCIHEAADLLPALERIGTPAILKRADCGYDGKGQRPIKAIEDLLPAFHALGNHPCILEQRITLKQEISVILARGAGGEAAIFPIAENRHHNGILDCSIIPALLSPSLASEAVNLALRIAHDLAYRGVMAVEFFITTGGDLLVNEIAPRPHNSGHYTVDACPVSQFEQQLRALCGLPLGDTRLLSPVVMINLLGDLWHQGEPDWTPVFACPGARLHLYGKRLARPGRKMGHFCVLNEDRATALTRAQTTFARLASQTQAMES